MKRDSKRTLLAGLTLLAILGAGAHLAQRPVHAQMAQSQTTSFETAGSPQPEGAADDAYRKSKNVRTLGHLIGLNADQSANLSEVVNFLLLAGLLGWVVARVLPKTLRARTHAIEKHLVEAREATEAARARLSQVEERLAKLDGEIAAMHGHAEEELVREEQRLRTVAEEERRKILASAEQEISAATMHAQKQLQQHAAELAIEQAARKLVVSAETDRLLVQGFAQRLTGDESKKGQN